MTPTTETKTSIRSTLKSNTPSPTKTTESSESRADQIRTTAYFLAEKRNFAPGHEAEDWVKAEAIVNKQSTKKS